MGRERIAWLTAALLAGGLLAVLPAAGGLTGSEGSGPGGQVAGAGTTVLSLEGLRLPSLPAPGAEDGPMWRPGSTTPAADRGESHSEDGNASEDQVLDQHGRTPAGDQAGAFPFWSLLWGLPVAAMAAGTVIATQRARRPEQPDPEPAASRGSPPPTPGVDGVLEMGRDAVAEGRFEDAIPWFETAIAARPRLAVSHHCLGLCLYELGRFEQAVEAFRHAVSLQPGNPALEYNLARGLAASGRTEAAMDLVVEVIEAYPGMFDQLRADPVFEDLVDHPVLLARLGRL